MINNTFISVCLLSFNHAHLLPAVIRSILNQTHKNFELIISDDNSTDNSWKIISEYAAKYDFIKAYKTTNNLGMAENANFAISKAKYDIVALLHHDDLLNKDLFDKWLTIILKSDNIGFVFNDYLANGKSASENKITKKFSDVMNGKWFLKHDLLKRFGCYVRGTALIRKGFFKEIGGMDDRFGLLADVDLWMRLSAKWDVGYVNSPLIEIKQERPIDYPKDYSEFSWNRIFILFDIHANNINRNNFPNYFQYLIVRFIFRNKVSFEIIKWHFYAIYKKRKDVLEFYPGKNKNELFYSILICRFIRLFYK